MIEPESGYIGDVDAAEFVGSVMTREEIIRTTGVNVLATGCRYGRKWLLKGLAPDVRDSSAMQRRLLKEFEIHSRLNHPGIVQAIGLEKLPSIGLCIVEEWIEGKTLSQLMLEDSLSKGQRRRIIREIIQAVGYLHSKGIVHRDLKPSNIMVREAGGDAVLIDFGLADTNDYVEFKQSAGTEGFISPEQLAEGGARTSDDVYSLGVIMRELCPAYGNIAKRCTGSADRRPKDARALMKALDSHDRRPRRIAVTVTVMAVLALSGAAGWRISTLSRAVSEAEQRAEALEVETAHSTAHASRLEDSLKTISLRMQESEIEMHRQEEYRKNLARVMQTGHRKANDILSSYDNDVKALSPDQRQEFSDLGIRLQNEFRQWVDEFCSSEAVAQLEKQDRDRMWMEQYNHFTSEYTKYHDRWMKKFYPQHFQ